jgi:hypothetical protein
VEPGPVAPEPVPSALRHRYTFSGNGTVVADAAGNADGTIFGGASLAGDGQLQLDGVDDFVQLPDGLISSLDDASLMVWATWRGDSCWERLFDFGNNLVVGTVVEADTSLFMTPHWCRTEMLPAVRLEFRTHDSDAEVPYVRFTASSPDVLTAPEPHHYVATLDTASTQMFLYIDGTEVGRSSLVDAATGATHGLGDVRDLDNWLGRSQYLVDAFFMGDFDEFRIYGVALDAAAIQAAFEAGPDTVLNVE